MLKQLFHKTKRYQFRLLYQLVDITYYLLLLTCSWMFMKPTRNKIINIFQESGLGM